MAALAEAAGGIGHGPEQGANPCRWGGAGAVSCDPHDEKPELEEENYREDEACHVWRKHVED